ncbi:hypothetical protein EUU23_09310 [Sphingorhabdus sp. IMCC26285]|uniref:MarR family transcriptional regulator n=1 Tax=Sphingorhabdus profundilacus TaxID=2509718 RepID=A0A6I4M0Y0_9SPHN|nr:hypothetical protein [Sphingorhabdus profundilacus]MVZ97904.1 hypothetical protein [Sphingorhabdus profundilacus]
MAGVNRVMENYGKVIGRKTAMIFADSIRRHGELEQLAHASGYVTLARDPSFAADYILVDISSETEPLADSLTAIVRYLEQHRSTAVVWINLDGLEDALAVLPQGQCHFLIDANDVEAMPILAGALGTGRMDRLHDRDHPVEFGSLHRISDELAQFARTLARIADTDRPKGLSDKPVSFRPAPIGGFQPFADLAAPSNRRLTSAQIREIIRLRRHRERFFDSELFADPAWDILLDLKAAQLENQNVSVSSLCIAAAVPSTTALRWVTVMTESGMLVRRQDPDDARRVFIELSSGASAQLDEYFASIADRLVQIV